MHSSWRRPTLLLAVGTLLVSNSTLKAGTDDPADPVAIEVGEASLSLEALQERVSRMTPLEIGLLGANEQRIREQLLQQIVIPELLLSEEAKRRKLLESPGVQQQVDHVLVRTLEARLRQDIEREGISEEAVARYYAEHRGEFERPQRLRLFRLLVRDEGAARKLIGQARELREIAKWRELVREHSVDKATSLRGGDVGFVHPDGKTDVPRVRVPRALYQAAASVKDGELVPEPVPEGDHFAVVWRRGSLPAVQSSAEVEAPRIRRLLIETQLHQELETLKHKLAEGRVSRHNLELLDELTLLQPSDPRLPASALLPERAHDKARPGVAPGETGIR